MVFGAEEGVWKVTQDSETRALRLEKYGHVVDEWQGERMYSFDELHEILIQKSYEKRSGD